MPKQIRLGLLPEVWGAQNEQGWKKGATGTLCLTEELQGLQQWQPRWEVSELGAQPNTGMTSSKCVKEAKGELEGMTK